MDLVHTEIMKNRFTAIAEEVAAVAYRAAHTTLVKQTQDFTVVLANTRGESIGTPVLTGAIGAWKSVAGLIEPFSEYAPGDVIISNDPFNTGGVITHQMDILRRNLISGLYRARSECTEDFCPERIP